MVSQLLSMKCKETPSTKACCENPKKDEKKLEIECKIETKMGECNYNKTQVHLCVEDKVGIEPYVGKLMLSN
jgi:hypothetical protein